MLQATNLSMTFNDHRGNWTLVSTWFLWQVNERRESEPITEPLKCSGQTQLEGCNRNKLVWAHDQISKTPKLRQWSWSLVSSLYSKSESKTRRNLKVADGWSRVTQSTLVYRLTKLFGNAQSMPISYFKRWNCVSNTSHREVLSRYPPGTINLGVNGFQVHKLIYAYIIAWYGICSFCCPCLPYW